MNTYRHFLAYPFSQSDYRIIHRREMDVSPLHFDATVGNSNCVLFLFLCEHYVALKISHEPHKQTCIFSVDWKDFP